MSPGVSGRHTPSHFLQRPATRALLFVQQATEPERIPLPWHRQRRPCRSVPSDLITTWEQAGLRSFPSYQSLRIFRYVNEADQLTINGANQSCLAVPRVVRVAK